MKAAWLSSEGCLRQFLPALLLDLRVDRMALLYQGLRSRADRLQLVSGANSSRHAVTALL